MKNELVWFENGKLVTQREVLQRKYGRRVSEEEALQYVRRQQEIQKILAYAKLKKVTK